MHRDYIHQIDIVNLILCIGLFIFHPIYDKVLGVEEDMSVKKLVGKRIKNLRKSERMTQEELAEKMGISAKYLSSIERGQENPTLDTLIKLADSLRIELEEIFTVSHEVSDPKLLRKSLDRLLKGADESKLGTAVKILKATFH